MTTPDTRLSFRQWDAERFAHLRAADRAALGYAALASASLGLYAAALSPWFLTTAILLSVACYLRCWR